MSRKRKVCGECAYCGEVTELTKDHVIPKCLFQKPRPSKPVIVWACRPCNLEKSKTDDYLRDFLVLDAYSSENSVAQAIFHESMLSSVRQNSSALAKAAMSKSRLHSIVSPGGIYLGDVLSFPIEGLEIFSRIARGLYYNLQKQRIPDNYIFDVNRPDPLRLNEIMTNILQLPHKAFHVGNAKEFVGIFLGSAEDPFTMIWLLWFYQSICIYVGSKPPTASSSALTGAIKL